MTLALVAGIGAMLIAWGAIIPICYFWGCDHDIMAMASGIFLFLAGIALCLGLIVPAFANQMCIQFSQQTHLPTKFNIYNGCFIKTEHGWLPQPQYIQLEQTNTSGS